MANWWDTLGTGIGDSLIGMQTPFGMSPPNLDPAQRQAMIANSLITLGGNIAGSGKNPAVGLARGVSQLQQNAGESLSRGAYFQQLQDTATERKAQKEAQNRTREWAKTQPWAKDYPIDSMSGDDIFRLASSANKPPNPVNWQTVTTGDGIMAFNPETLETRKIGSSAAQPPRLDTVTVDGMVRNRDPITGQLVGEPLGRAETRKSSALPPELAGRVAMAENFLKQAPALREEIKSGGVTGPLQGMGAQFGVGKAGSTYRKIQSGVDALLRSLTGAGMSIPEAQQYAARYLPAPTDSAATVLDKFDELSQELDGMIKKAYEGRGGNEPAPQNAGYKIISVE